MAEFGAHITGGITEADVPSIFEVLAQENLVSALRPAVNYVFKVAAENNPHRFGWLCEFGDEIYGAIELILENYCLKHYSASFAENFYGLKRVATSKSGKIQTELLSLPTCCRLKSLLFLVLVPYIIHKCDQLYSKLLDKQELGIQPASGDLINKNKLCTAFLVAYPYVHSMWEGVQFMYKLAYIFGKSKYHSLFLKWAGVMLKSLDAEDIERQKQWKNVPFNFENKSMIYKIWMVVSTSVSYSAAFLTSSLSVGVFFVQFLEWWYNSDHGVATITSLPIPDPPKRVKNGDNKVAALPTICPLCNKVRTNDTVLAVTGYVFCYPCIYKYVNQWQQCPITGLSVTQEHLVKLYLPD